MWAAVERHRAALDEHGALATRRADQQVDWMWSTVRDRLTDRLRTTRLFAPHSRSWRHSSARGS